MRAQRHLEANNGVYHQSSQKTKLTISRLMSCFHQLPGRSLCASILYHFFFQWQFVRHPYTNLYLLFLPGSFNRSKLWPLVSFRFRNQCTLSSISPLKFLLKKCSCKCKSLYGKKVETWVAWVGLEPNWNCLNKQTSEDSMLIKGLIWSCICPNPK